MTRNHKQKLDPALLRAGRSDLHVEFNNASVNQMRNMFLKFFPGEDESAEKFSKLLPEYKISMA